jgi:pSer/pThr/pTyr-binding forkhead associated (FHA) protein
MEKLIVLSEEGVSREFPLTGKTTTIGREEDNHICLGDKSVSRYHAKLQRVFTGFTIQDENSTNGTRVNGRVISKQFLKNRDLIEIGNYHLRYVETALDQQLEDDDKTTVIQRPTRQPELPPLAKGTAAAASSPVPASIDQSRAGAALESKAGPVESVSENVDDVAKVVYLAGEHKDKQLTVDRAFFSVGEPGGDLVLINKRHSGYFLLKVGGDTPPTINGQPIKAGGVELHNGDRIDLGDLSLEFRIKT